jgi:hypothetical protein
MTRPRNTALARTRAERRELRQLMAHVSAVVHQRMAEAIAEGLFDGPAMDAVPGVVIEGRIEGDQVIVDGPPVPTRRSVR